MGRAPCCDKTKVKRGPWSPEEDITLKNYVERYGTGGNWIALPQKAGLKRCGKSCRLRWLNYLRPDIKHGGFTEEEDNIIISLYNNIGSRWSVIASRLQGRTDNDVKNHWNTRLKKKLMAAAASSFIVTTQTTPISNNITTFNISSNTNSINYTTTGNKTTFNYDNQMLSIESSNYNASMGIDNPQPEIIPEMLLSEPTNHFPLPRLIEVQESQADLSSISPSFSVQSNCASWSGNEGGSDGFLMDFAAGSSNPCDILEGIVFHGDQITDETSPNYSNYAYSSFFGTD